MSRPITPQEYQEMLDGEDWSPATRAFLQHQQARAEKRDQVLAKITEHGHKQMLVYRWQQESLRVFHRFLAKQFEVFAWESRERKPRQSVEARNAVERKRRGVRQRIARAHREAAEGCRAQSEWLELHAELINALERPQRCLVG